MTMQYNNPAGDPAVASTMSPQLLTHYYQKQALIDARRLQYFMPLADVVSMPKNFGRKIQRYHYLPLLHDANINDQGIDAAGATITIGTYTVTFPRATVVVANASKAAAVTAINDNVGSTLVATAGANDSGGTGLANITLVSSGTAVRGAISVNAVYLNSTKVAAVTALNVGSYANANGGNLFGSSRDIGSISGKLPALSETGGRVNRVGFKRVMVEGTLEKFGFFDEYTQESLDFDTDAELEQHITREMVNGAMEITEDTLQIDLLNSAGLVRYAGDATQTSEIRGAAVGGLADIVTYSDLMHLNIQLDLNRCPKATTISTGTRLIDTKTIPAARFMYIGSELLPTIKAMTDLHSNQAFIPVERYASGTTTVNGEIGAVDQFRLVIHPQMFHWEGAGADIGSDYSCYYNAGKYSVFPMLVVGDESFTTVGFQTDGKTVKFKITTKKPGDEMATTQDPYGEKGFMSIKWYYGFMPLRPERLALIKTAAKL